MSDPGANSAHPLRKLELVVPFQYGARDKAPRISRVKSTLLTASLVGIRQMGWEDRYYSVLPQGRHEQVRDLVAGCWTPIDLADAHYLACDRMGLTPAEMTKIGEDVSHRTQRSFAATLAKASGEAGATPWAVFATTRRVWERIYDGGDIAVYKVGPKEAYVEVANCQLLRLPYFRAAFRAYFRAVVLLMAKVVYTTELTKHGTEASGVFRFSWV